jgi:hypothetical protein
LWATHWRGTNPPEDHVLFFSPLLLITLPCLATILCPAPSHSPSSVVIQPITVHSSCKSSKVCATSRSLSARYRCHQGRRRNSGAIHSKLILRVREGSKMLLKFVHGQGRPFNNSSLLSLGRTANILTAILSPHSQVKQLLLDTCDIFTANHTDSFFFISGLLITLSCLALWTTSCASSSWKEQVTLLRR